MAGLTVVSKVLGFGRDAVLAAVFGAGADLDAYLVAQAVPNVAVGLVGSSVATALVPGLSRRLRDGDDLGAGRLVWSALTIVAAAVLVLCAALALLARPVVDLLAPGFDPAQRDLAVDLTRILLGAAVFVAATNVVSALLFARRRFVVANLVGVPFNLSLIVAALVFGGDHGVGALAVGFLVGSVLRLAILAPSLRRSGLGRPWRPLVSPTIRPVLVLALPLLLASVVSNVSSITDRIVGSSAEEGTISALSLAYRLLVLPHTLLVLALGQVALPTLSVAEPVRASELIRRGVTLLAAVLVPLAGILLALAEPLVTVVYARGEFDAADVELARRAVTAYAVGVAALGLRDFLTRCHLSGDDSRSPLVAAAVAMVVNVAGDLTVGRRYGVWGLAGSTTVSFLVALAVSWVLLVRRRPDLDLGGLAATLTRVAVLAVVAGLGAAAVHDRLEPAFGAGSWAALAALATSGAAGGALYLAALRTVDRPTSAGLAQAARQALPAARRPR